MGGRWGLFLLGWAMILAGGLLAHLIQNSGGVRVLDVRFPGRGGVEMSGLLYVPRKAAAVTPAPAILASHGYINTREMQSPFAIELARRGFVVLAMDMTGHGYSGGAVGANDGGGPDALSFLQRLPFVDRSQIGLEGHSMGGVPVVGAALDQPGGYRAMVLEGSTTPQPGQVGAGSPAFPRNLEVVFGRYDEFAPLMWGVARGAEAGSSKKLEALFGSPGPVTAGRIYGSIAAGTARRLLIPPVTHPWEHFSAAGVGAAVDWFQRTLKGEASPKTPGDQIWPWKEAGTLAALVGFVVLLLGTFRLLIETRVFAALRAPLEEASAPLGVRGWAAIAVTAALPAVTYYPLMNVGYLFAPSRLFPEWVGNQILVWIAANALISLALGLIFRGPRGVLRPNRLALAVAAGVATVAVGYAALALSDLLFKTDFRFWVVGLKPLDARHFIDFLFYAPPLVLAFALSLNAALPNMRLRQGGEGRALAIGAAAYAAGFIVLLAISYGVLFATGVLPMPKEALSTIIAIQFAPILAAVGVIGAYAYRRTAMATPGAVICGLVVAWYIAAGTATHWSPGWSPPKMAGLYPVRPAPAVGAAPAK